MTVAPAGLVAVVACGAVAEEPPQPTAVDRSPPGFWPPEATTGTTNAVLGDVLDVPGGRVRIGEWKFVGADRTLAAGACDAKSPASSTARLRLAPFRLMRFEVSNRMYASCVTSGRCKPPDADLSNDPSGATAWDDPRAADRPAAASQLLSRAFCRAHGGDLPTLYQWVRAAEGDDGAFGIKALTDAWVRCELGEVLPLCESLRRASWSPTEIDPKPPLYRPLLDVAGSPWDVGPYGHAGLFGGAGEWVRDDHSRLGPKPDCSSEGLLADDFIRASYESPPDELISVMQIGRDLALMGNLGRPEALGLVAHGTDSEPAGKGRYFTGFRCAFPPRAQP